MGGLRSALPHLPPLIAVATLSLGTLALFFAGWEVAMVVFVIGWFLLAPATAILFGPPSELSIADALQSADGERATPDRNEGAADGADDPIETLRQRYARGELSDEEFERRLEALLELDDIDPADESAIERAIENLRGSDRTDERDVEFERE